MIAAEKDWAKAGYDGALLTLGQVKGKQYGMGFSLSTPIIYFNADLVKKAGGDPDNFPKTWDGIFALAKKINDPANKIAGFHFDWDITGNWMWQALVFSNGGTMLTPTRRRWRSTARPGQKAIETLRLMITDGDDARREPGDGAAGLRLGPPRHLGALDLAPGRRHQAERRACSRCAPRPSRWAPAPTRACRPAATSP